MVDMINKDGAFAICATVQEADLDAAGFAALTWVDVENIVNIPALGVTDNLVSQDYLNTDVSQVRKGFRAGTQEELTCGYDIDATGQAAVVTAADTGSNYAVRRTLPDGTIIYSRAVVANNGGVQGGSGEDFINVSWMIGVNQVPVIVAAA